MGGQLSRCEHDINGFSAFISALEKRHAYFPFRRNCRLSTTAETIVSRIFVPAKGGGRNFDKARKGAIVSAAEHSQFASFMMLFFGHLDAKRGWTKQLPPRRVAQQ